MKLVPALGLPCLLAEHILTLGDTMASDLLFFTISGVRLAFLARKPRA